MPPPARRLTSCAFASALCAAALVAQGGDVARRPTFSRVVDGAGEPIADAEVVFVGGLPHLARTVASVDVQRVGSDKRGRAIARLREDLCYVVWAVGPAVADGARTVSEVQGYFSAGALLDVPCTDSRPTAATLGGLEAWREHGPLRLFAMTPAPGDEVELAAGEDGRLSLPPGPYSVVEVRGPDGQPLWSTRRGDAMTMPPPRRVPVLVVDEEGAPLAGVEVVHRVARLGGWPLDGFPGVGDERLRPLGTTGADGRCDVLVPYDGDPLREAKGDLLLLARPPGRPVVASGVWSRSIYASDRKVPRIDGGVLRFECGQAAPLVGGGTNDSRHECRSAGTPSNENRPSAPTSAVNTRGSCM